MAQIVLNSIVPRPLNAQGMRAELLRGLKTLGLEIRYDFEATTDTWNDKPIFEPFSSDPVVVSEVATVRTETDEKVYKWVNDGTKPHKIVPVNAKMLVFPGVFRPKTVPGVILANPGFSGPPMEFRGAEGVNHPGVEPRKFDETIKKKQEKNAKNIMDFAILRARQVSGHAYP